ncbi:MoaD/ThiS family protein [Chloroflexota bacterium]
MTVEVYGHYSTLAGGKKKETMEIANPTIEGLLKAMEGSWTRRFMEEIVDPETKQPALDTMILVNSRSIYHLEGVETVLKDGDVIVMMPPIMGG